jgi:hypothetical protein
MSYCYVIVIVIIFMFYLYLFINFNNLFIFINNDNMSKEELENLINKKYDKNTKHLNLCNSLIY